MAPETTDAALLNDPLKEAIRLVRGAAKVSIPLRLVGGLAIRYLCPDFPLRARSDQDMDLASTSSARSALARYLTDRGYRPDARFNALHGHKQLFFHSPEGGRAIDILIDRLEMCHALDFRDRIDVVDVTLSMSDLLLTKLQIVELNRKDAQDILYLLGAYPLAESDGPRGIGLARFREVVGNDWGWWKTVNANLDKTRSLATQEGMVPPTAPLDPVEQIEGLVRAAQEAPKSVRWKLRARIGERVRWYTIPEEAVH